jgi:acyl carrier protein
VTVPAGVLDGLREILARVTRSEQAAAIAPDAPLFGGGAGLDSLTGTLLLLEVRRRYGVDVAAEDLSLDSLASLATLAAFIAGHTALRDTALRDTALRDTALRDTAPRDTGPGHEAPGCGATS